MYLWVVVEKEDRVKNFFFITIVCKDILMKRDIAPFRRFFLEFYIEM